ncbi:MAG: hypothetical protein ACYC4Q_02615 [Victivallaceae bacterium]
MKMQRNNYTVLELLFVIACVVIIISMLLPAFNESREKARFARWVVFNRQCSSDPTCVVNYNFQEGKGTVIANSAQGHESNKFKVKDYFGNVKGDCRWTKGRWWKGKRALQFNGVNTIVELPEIEAIDFDEDEEFTIVIWLKFDRFNKWATPFSKAYADQYAQYDLYYDGTQYSTKQATGQFEVDVSRTCIGFDDVTIDDKGNRSANIVLDTEHWYMLTLRNRKMTTDPQNVGLSNINDHKVEVFWNGQRLAERATNNVYAKGTRCKAKLILGAMRFWSGQNSGPGWLGCYFQGKVDEFIMYKRALQDTEIRGHYIMGAEHL